MNSATLRLAIGCVQSICDSDEYKYFPHWSFKQNSVMKKEVYHDENPKRTSCSTLLTIIYRCIFGNLLYCPRIKPLALTPPMPNDLVHEEMPGFCTRLTLSTSVSVIIPSGYYINHYGMHHFPIMSTVFVHTPYIDHQGSRLHWCWYLAY